MKKAILATSALLMVFGVVSPANAQDMANPSPYLASPVSDETLAAACAQALPGFASSVRALSDQDSKLYLDQVAESNRISMDNWWAQTGAALITNNLLSSVPKS